MSITHSVSKKCQDEMDRSLAICDKYKDVYELDEHDRFDAMEYLNEWAFQVELGLSKHMYQSHMMMAWITCMINFLCVHSGYVDEDERINMVAGCLPRILEVFAFYTTHADFKVRHQVCRAVVNVLRTMVDAEATDEEVTYNTWQPAADTRVDASDVIGAYLQQLTADQEEWRVAFNNPVFDDSDYDDDYGVNDVKFLGEWVRTGMYISTGPLYSEGHGHQSS
jgi:hypothetical protein